MPQLLIVLFLCTERPLFLRENSLSTTPEVSLPHKKTPFFNVSLRLFFPQGFMYFPSLSRGIFESVVYSWTPFFFFSTRQMLSSPYLRRVNPFWSPFFLSRWPSHRPSFFSLSRMTAFFGPIIFQGLNYLLLSLLKRRGLFYIPSRNSVFSFFILSLRRFLFRQGKRCSFETLFIYLFLFK